MQNAVLFATAYIQNQQAWLTRYKPWIDYYQQSPLGGIPLVLIDDGSPYLPDDSEVTICDPSEHTELRAGQTTIFHFNKNLGRTSLESYPGWWRSFLFSAQVARSNQNCKLIHIESDAYILSQRMFQKIVELDTGWTTFWLQKYQMPETAIQVICPDQLRGLEQIKTHPMLNLEMAEKFLPFTEVDKEMVGDRYSEFKRNRWIFRSRRFDGFPLFKTDFFFKPIPPNADFATQVVPRQLKDSRLKNPVKL